MRQAPLDIVAGSYSDETRPFSSQDTVNYLPVFAEQGGTRTPTMLKTPPGLRPFVQVTDGGNPIGPVRRTHNCEGKLFAVMGQTLYQVTASGVAIPQGTVPGIGRCSMAHNQLATGNQLVTVNGTSGYVFNTQSQVFERITDEGFPGAIKVIFMDGYIIGIEPRRRFAFTSEVADALAYNTLDRFTSEYLPDLLVSLESVQNQLVLFSEGSMEFFENTGATEQPFRSKRISQKRGCAGTFTTAVIDQTVYWLGDDGIFYRLEGYAPRRISTRPIEQAIRGLDWKNAFAETWTDAGHLVVYWTFPDGLTWGYDISSGQWHRRQSYGFNRWRPNTLTYINNEWVAGDFQNGRLWKLDWDYVLEGDEEIISERTTQTLADNQNRMLISRLELIVDTGQPLTEPVPFPEQPEGPSISGNAPDGAVAVSWGPYSYVTSGGLAPLRVSLKSGALPPGVGPLSTSGTIAAGVPTSTGMYPFTVRVTDANGLYDDLEDVISIANVSVAMYLQGGVNSTNVSGSGTDWTDAYEDAIGSGIRFMFGGKGRLISWTTTAAQQSTNLGNTWTPMGSISNGGLDGIHWKTWDIIAAGSSGIFYAADGATSLTQNAAMTAGAITGTSTALVALVSGETTSKSVTTVDGVPVTGGAHGLFLGVHPGIDNDGTQIRAGSKGNGVTTPDYPRIVISDNDGASWVLMDMPVLATGSYVRTIKHHDGIWVFGTSAGDVLCDDGSGIELVLSGLNNVLDINHNGAVFMLSYEDGSNVGHFKYSVNGRDWFDAPSGTRRAEAIAVVQT